VGAEPKKRPAKQSLGGNPQDRNKNRARSP
jgi:hypothetical protein